jgi:hypothetical protein
MEATAVPNSAIDLFDSIQATGNKVAVVRPPISEETESGIVKPESVRAGESEETDDVILTIQSVGPDVTQDFERGDRVLVSLFFDQPHQIVSRVDEQGVEHALFLLDDGMIVAQVND